MELAMKVSIFQVASAIAYLLSAFVFFFIVKRAIKMGTMTVERLCFITVMVFFAGLLCGHFVGYMDNLGKPIPFKDLSSGPHQLASSEDAKDIAMVKIHGGKDIRAVWGYPK